MAHIYKYAILTAVPDQTRGERVNVGIVIFRNSELDVRFTGVSKISAISGGEWSAYAAETTERMREVFSAYEEPEQFVVRFSVLEQLIQFSEISWFSAASAEEYEVRAKQVLDAFVRKPKEDVPQKMRSSKINTEIAAVFRHAKLLAKSDETIEDHKIIRDYYISQEEQLRADFVHKNGAFHVTATLDLRRPTVDLGQAALKAIVLDKASDCALGDTKRYAVFAVEPESRQFKAHVELLHDYSDRAFNWLIPDEREKYTRTIYQSLTSPFDLN